MYNKKIIISFIISIAILSLIGCSQSTINNSDEVPEDFNFSLVYGPGHGDRYLGLFEPSSRVCRVKGAMNMNNSLTIRVDTPYVLNFLIYLQNIYLNQKHREDHLKFPFFSGTVMFHAEFELRFKELWDDVSNRISEDDGNSIDLKIFYDESDLFFQKLFAPNAGSLKSYNEIHLGFQVWWRSLAGSFSVERAFEVPGNNLYEELTNSLKENKIAPKGRLHISLVYDECRLANTSVYPYFAVLSIPDFIANKESLIHKLYKCIDYMNGVRSRK